MKFFWIFILLGASAWAGTYAYHPSHTLHLGAGFDPAYPERAFQSCLEYDGRMNVDGEGAIKTEYSLSLVKNKKELFDRLGLSASFSARGLFWGASAGVDYFSEHRFHSDSITWMLMGKSEYGRFILKNPRLSHSAKHLVDSNQHEAFERQCGTEFIKQERRSTLIAAIFSMENVSQQDIGRLETYFQSSVSVGFFEASAKARYNRFISEATRVQRIRMSVYAIGGSGITELSHLMLHPDDLGEIQKILEQYMKKLDESHAVPAEYVSGSLTAFGARAQTPAEVMKRERILAELYYRYEQTHSAYKRLESLGNLREEYQKQYNQYGVYLSTILDAADACYQSYVDCKLPPQNLERIRWPSEASSACEQARFEAYGRGLIDKNEFDRLAELNMAPVLKTHANEIGAYVFCQDFRSAHR